MKIGFGQTCFGSDLGHGRAAEASAGEHGFGRRQDQRFVVLADLPLALFTHRCGLAYLSLADASQITWLIAAMPGSFLITGELPPVISTLTVRS